VLQTFERRSAAFKVPGMAQFVGITVLTDFLATVTHKGIPSFS
jgi:hypothetical protein